MTSLADIAALADANRDMTFKVMLKRCVRLVRIEPGRLDVNLTGDAPKTLLGDLTVKLKAWTGRNWMVSLSREEGGPTLGRDRGEQARDRRSSTPGAIRRLRPSSPASPAPASSTCAFPTRRKPIPTISARRPKRPPKTTTATDLNKD